MNNRTIDNEGTDKRWRTKGGWFQDKKKRNEIPEICQFCKGEASYLVTDPTTLKSTIVTCDYCNGTGEHYD